MITSYQTYRSERIWLGHSTVTGPCACREIWRQINLQLNYENFQPTSGNTQYYYIDSQENVGNDIRYVTILYSNAQLTQLAPAGYYAQIIPEQVSGSQYWWVFWNGTSISQLTQVVEGDLHSIYHRTGIDDYTTTCNIQHHPVYFPSGQTFATATTMHEDPFGCGLLSDLNGYCFNTIGSGSTTLVRYWYGNFLAINFSGWQISTGYDYSNPGVGGISVNYSTSAVDSVCTPNNDFPQLVWQSCPDTLGTLQFDRPIIYPTINISTAELTWSYAPSGYYHAPVNAADLQTHYWNGESGVWGGLPGLDSLGVFGGLNNPTIDCGG